MSFYNNIFIKRHELKFCLPWITLEYVPFPIIPFDISSSVSILLCCMNFSASPIVNLCASHSNKIFL